jgi:hypothetical protein
MFNFFTVLCPFDANNLCDTLIMFTIAFLIVVQIFFFVFLSHRGKKSDIHITMHLFIEHFQPTKDDALAFARASLLVYMMKNNYVG